MSFRELLNKGPFFLDGGMGTLLQAQGLSACIRSATAWPTASK